jgi:DNA-binding MarR family transcriptional regulator
MDERFKIFTNHINSINRSIRRIKNIEMKEYDLKSPHVSCIYYLYKEKSLSIKELTKLCDVDKSAISRTLDYLLNNDFIIINGDKGYKNNLILTNKGNIVGKYISDKVDNILNYAGNGLTEEERKILYKALDVIDNNLKEIVGENNGN